MISEPGSPAATPTEPEVSPLVARINALAAASRAREQQQSTTLTREDSPALRAGRSALHKARIPSVLWGAEWDKVTDAGVYEWSIPLPARTLQRSDATPPNWSLLGHGLMVLGPVGTGKSSAAALCAMELLTVPNRTVRWSYVPELLDTLSLSTRDRMAEVKAQSSDALLVWDDFGVRGMADWEIGFLDQIVDARYRARKPMIVTSNLTASDIRTDVRLARMVDRWRERTASTLIRLSGESRRGEGNDAGRW